MKNRGQTPTYSKEVVSTRMNSTGSESINQIKGDGGIKF